jgi:enamine deaminase RidA (YjgF/YER057c/UK114 family)
MSQRLPRSLRKVTLARLSDVLVDRFHITVQQEKILSDSIKRHIFGPVHSRVVEYGGLVYVAGTTADKRDVDCKRQTEEILKKIDEYLATGGSNKSRLLQATVWLSDIRDKAEMDAAWKTWIDPDNKPARACVESRLGTPDTRVEIMVVAAKA